MGDIERDPRRSEPGVAGRPTSLSASVSPGRGALVAVAVVLLGVFEIVGALGSLLDPGVLVVGLQGGIAVLVRVSGQLHLGFGVLLLGAGVATLVACIRRCAGSV